MNAAIASLVNKSVPANANLPMLSLKLISNDPLGTLRLPSAAASEMYSLLSLIAIPDEADKSAIDTHTFPVVFLSSQKLGVSRAGVPPILISVNSPRLFVCHSLIGAVFADQQRSLVSLDRDDRSHRG